MPETRQYKIDGSTYKLTGDNEADFVAALEALTQKLSGREEFVDDTTGAPLRARLAVGGAENEDRIATMRNLGYEDVRPAAGGNMVFRNPQTDRLTLYNPPGVDIGDVVSLTPEVAETAGAIGGAAVTAPPAIAAAPFTGGASLPTIMAGSALGSQAAREAENILATQLLGRVDTRDLPKRLQDVAVRGALNAPQGPPTGQAVRNALGVSDKAAENLARLERQGITPTAPVVTESPLLQRINEGTVAFGGAGPYGRKQEEILQQFSDVGRRFVERLRGNKSDLEVGQTIRREAEQARESFGKMEDKAFGKFYSQFDSKTPVQLTNTLNLRAQLNELPKPVRDMLSAEFNTFVPKLEKAAKDGVLPFDVVRKMRTKVGQLTANPSNNASELKAIYAALSKDLDAAVAPAGEAAQKAYQVANRYTRFRRNTTMPLLDDIVQRGLDKDLVNIMVRETREQGGETLQRLRNILPKAAFDEVAGTVLNRLGRAKASGQGVGDDIMAQADDWSPNTFLTNWSKLTPEAKKALIGGTPYRDLAKPLDDLVRSAELLRDAEKFRNFSNTGGALIWSAVLGAGPAGVALGLDTAVGGLAIGGVASTYAVQKLLQNPRFVRWLAKAPEKVKGSKSLADYVGRLSYISTVEPEIKEEIDHLVFKLNEAVPNAR